MQAPFPPLHPLQALYYVVAGITAIGALYLGRMTFRAGRRDKQKEIEDKIESKQIAKETTAIEQALKAAEQAQFIRSLQKQIIDLKTELTLVKQRQRRGMAVQFSSALIFLSLLIGLFFYEKSINEQIGSANTQARTATDTANKASSASDQAVKRVNQVNTTVRNHQSASGHKKQAAEIVPPQ